jgi:hypothetical protein
MWRAGLLVACRSTTSMYNLCLQVEGSVAVPCRGENGTATVDPITAITTPPKSDISSGPCLALYSCRGGELWIRTATHIDTTRPSQHGSVSTPHGSSHRDRLRLGRILSLHEHRPVWKRDIGLENSLGLRRCDVATPTGVNGRPGTLQYAAVIHLGSITTASAQTNSAQACGGELNGTLHSHSCNGPDIPFATRHSPLATYSITQCTH